MPTFSGVVTQFEAKPTGFSFRIDGKKYSFKGNNLKGISEGDNVSGAYSVESFKAQDGKQVNWNKIMEVDKVTDAQLNRGTTAPSTSSKHAQSDQFTFPVPKDSYQRSVLRRECVRDAVAYFGGKTPSNTDAVIDIAKRFEAYVSGDLDAELVAKAMGQLTQTEDTEP